MGLNIPIFTVTDHGAIFQGKTAGFFVKSDGTQWTVGETDNGQIFFAETKNVQPLRKLYGVK